MSNIGAFRAALREASQRLAAAATTQIGVEAKALAASIKARAPARSGRLKEFVVAVQVGPNRWRVQAGGDLTTKKIGSRTYDRPIRVGSGEDTSGAGKGSSAVTYDYAAATEFGTTNETAEPFFYNTYRTQKSGIQGRVVAAASSTLD